MKKLKKLRANGIYLIVCRATSHEAFFENSSQLRIFKNQFRRHLDGICDVIEYIHIPAGYAYVIKTKSEKSILDWYQKKRSKSRNRTDSQPLMDVWRIISECFRHMGSTFVSICNRRFGREGTKFRKRYERYAFEDESELNFIIGLLHAGKIELDQKDEKYKILLKKTLWIKDDHVYEQLNSYCKQRTVGSGDMYKRALGILDEKRNRLTKGLNQFLGASSKISIRKVLLC